MTRTKAILLGLDQLLNAVVCGSPDETFSAACFRKAPHGKKRWVYAQKVINKLFFWDYEIRGSRKAEHCELSWEMELKRSHLPKEYK